MQQKNIDFFAKYHEELANAIRMTGTGRYEIQITDNFLNILDKETRQHCHPTNNLLEYIRGLGSWHHTAWMDKIAVTHRLSKAIEHGRIVLDFVENMLPVNPIFRAMFESSGKVTLPKLEDGRKFSGVVVFLGVFSGLHVLHYLSITEVKDAAFIEPDIESFSLSCYFLDYAALEKKFGRLLLDISPEIPDDMPTRLVSNSTISAGVWLRLLPAYHNNKEIHHNIPRFLLEWGALTEVFVPFDREVRNLVYGMRNLRAKRKICHTPPQLSSNSRIAIIGAGPSLDDDIAWLKENQHNLIIFSVHSAVRTLHKNGIRHDFQCNLDTEAEKGEWEKLKMAKDIPFVSYYKADPKSVMSYFDTVLMVNELGKGNIVSFNKCMTHTHPTTGNLALATAIFCQPAELYLLGLDLGFQNPDQDHVKGHWDDFEGDRVGRNPILAKANFPESQGKVMTYAYFYMAKQAVESSFSRLPGTKIYNCSDGVKFEGATPMRTCELSLSTYSEKGDDVAKIIASFSNEYEEILRPWQHSGAELLEKFKNNAKKTMELKSFSWREFTQRLDRCIDETNHGVILEPHDIRIEGYRSILRDLLSSWYRFMIFTETPAQAKEAYQKGYQYFCESIDKLTWPEELALWEEDLAEENKNRAIEE